MDYLVMIGQLMLSLSILIVLHEMGHYLTAVWFKTRAEKFYLFFDPWISLFKAKKINNKWQIKTALSKEQEFENDDPSKTEWGIGWLPLGGYVKIAGMIDESMDKEQMSGPEQPWEFRSKPAWQRLIIMLGGVIVNFLLGFLLFGMVLFHWGEEYLPNSSVEYGIYADSLGYEMGLRDGDKILKVGDSPFEKFNDREVVREIIINGAETIEVERNGQKNAISVDPKYIGILSAYENKNKLLFGPRIPTVVGKVTPGSNAEKGGMKAEDKIVAINGNPARFFNDFKNQLTQLKNQEVVISVIRGDLEQDLTMNTNEQGMVGFQPYGPNKFFDLKRQEYGLFEAIPAGFDKGVTFLGDQIKAFGKMFSGEIKATESMGGFGTFAKLYGDTWVWERFWKMTAIISLILAFMNLLPIPALDGGHVMFTLWEMITGKKPSDKFLEYATTIGFILVLGLVLFANGLDILRGCS